MKKKSYTVRDICHADQPFSREVLILVSPWKLQMKTLKKKVPSEMRFFFPPSLFLSIGLGRKHPFHKKKNSSKRVDNGFETIDMAHS